jgi:adenosylcobinamide-phosphate synthase
MISTLFTEITTYGLLPLVIICLVLLIERWIPWHEKYHPLTLFRLIAINLGKRVNPNKPRSDLQRRISGSLATMILLFPALAIIAFIVFIAQFPLFFDGFLLLIAMQYRPILIQFKRVQVALKLEKKSLARQFLSNIVLRETNRLSPIGIGKAAIESLLLRFFYQQFAIILWYLAGGGLAAITVRLLYELQQCWNTKYSDNIHFGAPIALLCRLVYLLPFWAFTFIFCLGSGFIGAIKAYRQRPPQFASYYLLKLIVAGSLGMQLGGPVYYQGEKKRLPKVGTNREVRFEDMRRAKTAVEHTLLVLIVAILLLTILVSQISLN